MGNRNTAGWRPEAGWKVLINILLQLVNFWFVIIVIIFRIQTTKQNGYWLKLRNMGLGKSFFFPSNFLIPDFRSSATQTDSHTVTHTGIWIQAIPMRRLEKVSPSLELRMQLSSRSN